MADPPSTSAFVATAPPSDGPPGFHPWPSLCGFLAGIGLLACFGYGWASHGALLAGIGFVGAMIGNAFGASARAGQQGLLDEIIDLQRILSERAEGEARASRSPAS